MNMCYIVVFQATMLVTAQACRRIKNDECQTFAENHRKVPKPLRRPIQQLAPVPLQAIYHLTSNCELDLVRFMCRR